MQFSEFSKQTKKTLVKDFSLVYLGLAAAGEMGECCNFIKKQTRDGKDYTEEIVLEVGDTLWYLSRLLEKLGSSLEQAAFKVLEKNLKRKKKS